MCFLSCFVSSRKVTNKLVCISKCSEKDLCKEEMKEELQFYEILILFILTLGWAGTNLAILPYLTVRLQTHRADILFDMLYTWLPRCQRGVVVIALTFPSYYKLSGKKSHSSKVHSHSVPPAPPLGVPLVFSLPFTFPPLPLYSKGFSLIILQCQTLSEGCNSQMDVSLAGGRTGGAPCVCEIMLPQSGGNFRSSVVLYQQGQQFPCWKMWRE